MAIFIKEVKNKGREIQKCNLNFYKYVWLDSDHLAILTSNGWDVYETVGWDELSVEPTLIVNFVGRISDLPVFPGGV